MATAKKRWSPAIILPVILFLAAILGSVGLLYDAVNTHMLILENDRDTKMLEIEEALRVKSILELIQENKTSARVNEHPEAISELKTIDSELVRQAFIFARVVQKENERDELLRNIAAILELNVNDTSIPNLEIQAREAHNSAVELFREVNERRPTCNGIPGDDVWNRAVWSRRGYQLYRSTIFVEDNAQAKQKILSLINEAVTQYKKVYPCPDSETPQVSHTKDNRTTVSIEYLLKTATTIQRKGVGKGVSGRRPLLPKPGTGSKSGRPSRRGH